MAGLSSTLYDAGSIEIVSGHSAAATSGGTITGRALSDVAHGSGAGLRYFEVELTSIRSSAFRFFGLGLTSSSGSLADWIGSGADHGVYLGAPTDSSVGLYLGGTSISNIGGSQLAAGARLGVWLDSATRKVWITSRPRNGWLVGVADTARPDLGTGESYTVAGSGAIRIAITPGYGSGVDRNVARLRSRHSELTVRELYGALPWDARTSTVVEDVSGVADDSTLKWAWFDEARPDILTEPTSKGTVTVASSAVSIAVTTSLDAGGVGFLVLSTTDGTIIQCRSHAAPAEAP